MKSKRCDRCGVVKRYGKAEAHGQNAVKLVSEFPRKRGRADGYGMTCNDCCAASPKMMRTFKFALYPNKTQEKQLEEALLQCQRIYNACLEQRNTAYSMQARASLNKIGQMTELTRLRAELPEYAAGSVEVQRSAIARLDASFNAFFEGRKAGRNAGYPKFRGRDHYNQFAFGGEGDNLVQSNRVLVPKIGGVKFKKHREIEGRVKRVSISRDAQRWWVCFSCEVDKPLPVAVETHCGIDVGLEHFLTTSDGLHVANPRFGEAVKEKRAELHRAIARKVRGSNGRKKAKRALSRFEIHVTNQRRAFACETAKMLCDKYDQVTHEDLQIKNMVRGSLSKSINDAAWGEFLRRLNVRGENTGKKIVAVDPRRTSQTCPQCGAVAKKNLSERTHSCECGCVMQRDHAAAQVIDKAGLCPVVPREVLVSSKRKKRGIAVVRAEVGSILYAPKPTEVVAPDVLAASAV